MALTVILVDEVAGAAWDVGAWAELAPLAEQTEATGRAGTVDILLHSYVLGVGTLPVAPRPGLVAVVGDAAAYPGNPDPWSYGFTGPVQSLTIAPRIDGLLYTLHCADFLADLNTALPALVFNGTDQPTDSSRVTALFATARMPGPWDASTFVGGPFVTYAAGTTTPYTGKVADILAQIAADGGAGAVPPRRWAVSAAWTNPADYPAGLTRAVAYYGADAVPPDAVPLTDDPTGQADYVAESFDRGNSSTALGQADTGQGWNVLAGTWGINNFRAYLPAGSADNAAIVESTIADGVVETTLQTVATDVGLAARVAPDTGGHLWAGWIWIAQPASSRYALYKRQGGSYGLIATLAVTPADGDLLRLTLAGSNLTGEVTRGGLSQGTVSVTDSFQAGATWHGLVAVAAQPSARWESFRVAGAGASYWNLQDTEDATGLFNVVLIAGPPTTPAPAAWDAGTTVNATTAAGTVQKVGGTDGAWDAGATTIQQLDGAGGEITWSTDNRLIGQDTFTRPDADFLGGLESGQDWQRSNAAYRWGIRGNTAAPVAVGSTGQGVAWVDAGAATCIVECQFSSLVLSASRLILRLTDEDNCLLVLPASSHYELYKRVGGALTLLGSGGTTPTSGDVIKVSLEGSTINVYTPGSVSPTISVTETFNQHATRHGIGTTSAGAACRWAAFTVRQLYAGRTVGLRHGSSVGTLQTPAFGVVFGSDRTAQVTEGGVLKGSPRTYAAGDFWRITATYVVLPTLRYEIAYSYRAAGATAWTLWYESATYPDLVLGWHTDVALLHLGASVTNLTWQPTTANLFADIGSISSYGVRPAGDVVSDNSLDTWNKRAAHAQGYFATHGLRKSYTLITARPYRGGTGVLFTCLRLGIVNQRKTCVQAKTDRATTKSRTQWLYNLTLDAPLRLAGVRDPLRFLSVGPDGVTTPSEPTGLTAGPGVPESGGQWSIVPFSWDDPTTNAQWCELWAQPVNGTGDVRDRFPATARAGTLPLTFLRPYHVQARFWPYAGQPGPWCAPIDAQGGPAGLIAAPTALHQLKTGYYPDGGGWTVVAFTRPTPQPLAYLVRWLLAGNEQGHMTFGGDPESTPPIPLQRNLWYTVEIASLGPAGQGPWSVPLPVRVLTIGPPPPPPGGGDGPDVPIGGWTADDPGAAALDTETFYRSGASFALTPTVGGSVTLAANGLQSVTPDTWLTYGLAAVRLDGDTDTGAALELQWGDAAGTPLHTDTIPLTPLPSGVTLTDGSDPLTDDLGHPLTTLPDLAEVPPWEGQIQVPTLPTGIKTLIQRLVVAASLVAAGTVYVDVYQPAIPALTAPALTPGGFTDAFLAPKGLTDPSKVALRTGPGGGYDIYDNAIPPNLWGRLYADSTGYINLLALRAGVGWKVTSVYGDAIFVGDPASGGGITINPAGGQVVTINNGVYFSSDGTAGFTGDIPPGSTIHVKDGLVTGYTP
jgi:hypothetical protein